MDFTSRAIGQGRLLSSEALISAWGIFKLYLLDENPTPKKLWRYFFPLTSRQGGLTDNQKKNGARDTWDLICYMFTHLALNAIQKCKELKLIVSQVLCTIQHCVHFAFKWTMLTGIWIPIFLHISPSNISAVRNEGHERGSHPEFNQTFGCIPHILHLTLFGCLMKIINKVNRARLCRLKDPVARLYIWLLLKRRRYHRQRGKSHDIWETCGSRQILNKPTVLSLYDNNQVYFGIDQDYFVCYPLGMSA